MKSQCRNGLGMGPLNFSLPATILLSGKSRDGGLMVRFLGGSSTLSSCPISPSSNVYSPLVASVFRLTPANFFGGDLLDIWDAGVRAVAATGEVRLLTG
jgi:hypothetical protein